MNSFTRGALHTVIDIYELQVKVTQRVMKSVRYNERLLKVFLPDIPADDFKKLVELTNKASDDICEYVISAMRAGVDGDSRSRCRCTGCSKTFLRNVFETFKKDIEVSTVKDYGTHGVISSAVQN